MNRRNFIRNLFIGAGVVTVKPEVMAQPANHPQKRNSIYKPISYRGLQFTRSIWHENYGVRILYTIGDGSAICSKQIAISHKALMHAKFDIINEVEREALDDLIFRMNRSRP